MKKLTDSLKTLLSDVVTMYFVAHGYHWNVEGADAGHFLHIRPSEDMTRKNPFTGKMVLNPDRDDLDIHDVINGIAKLPHQGTYDWDNDVGFNKFAEARPDASSHHDRRLNQEELAEHRNNFVFDPKHGPSKIHATLYNGDTDRTAYHYDTLTEKLHQVNE